MKIVSPFPYEDLPQLSALEVHLRKKLLQIYETAASPSAVLPLIAGCFQDILGGEVRLKLIGTEARKVEAAMSDLGGDFVAAVVRLDPLPHKAIVGFDPLLAQFLVAAILSGKPPEAQMATELKLKPLTVLQEAVVEYIIIDLIERITSKLGKKSFAPVYEDVVRESEKVANVWSAQDALAFLPIKLSWNTHDFYLKCFLPVVAADKMGFTRSDASFERERYRDLGAFPAEVILEVGRVALTPAEWETVETGDIIFLDELSVGMHGGRLTGQGRLLLTEGTDDAGFLCDLEIGDDGVQARIESLC
jgi:flagellar motor switch protein FliM